LVNHKDTKNTKKSKYIKAHIKKLFKLGALVPLWRKQTDSITTKRTKNTKFQENSFLRVLRELRGFLSVSQEGTGYFGLAF